MTSTRLLTWNLQLFSWAAMAVQQRNPAPENQAVIRSREIARRLVADHDDWDIVGLCEVWHEGAHDILDHDTIARYPHRVAKADDTIARIGVSGGESVAYWTPLLNMAVAGRANMTDRWTPEDSGLMLLSQLPFAMLSTAPLQAALEPVASALGLPFPATVPAVAFFPYDDSDDDDTWSRKGLLYARLLREQQPIHVFVTHTQADYTTLHQYERVRANQFAFVEQCIRACVGEPPFGGEVFVMGDLNVPGDQLNIAGDVEWRRLFATPGRLLTDSLLETWGAGQCCGPIEPHDRDNPCAGPIGLFDPGQTATCSAPPPAAQRLDYHLMSRTSALAAQHVRTRWDLSIPPIYVQYLSDHLPFSIDLASPLPNGTPATAECIPDAAIAANSGWRSGQRKIVDGQTLWFRFDRSGSYDFRVITIAGKPVHVELYSDADLSRRFDRHTMTPITDWGERYIVTASPMLLKVFPESKSGESFFEVKGRRHTGDSAATAIDVAWRVPMPEAHPTGDRLTVDDAKWFRITGTFRPIGRVTGTLVVQRTGGGAPFVVRLHRWADGANIELQSAAADEQGVAELPLELWPRDDLRFAILRHDADLHPFSYLIEVRTDVTFALGGGFEKVTLTCTKETSGWSNDDIEVDWSADGVSLAYINENTIDGFWEHMTQDIGQYLPDVTAFWQGLALRLIEKDAISDDDVGLGTIKPWDMMASTFDIVFHPTPGHPEQASIEFFIDVDDGEYRLDARMASWDPRI